MRKLTMRQARKRAGMTQQELAEKTGFQQSNLSMLEQGKTRLLDLLPLMKIEQVLDAVGEIEWEAAPPDLANVTLQAVQNLFDARYPIDAALVHVARLYRQGAFVQLLVLAGYDRPSIEKIAQQVDEATQGFTEKEKDKIIAILERRWTKTKEESE